MKRTWEAQNPRPPRQPRDNSIQIPVFVITLLLPLVATVFVFLKRYIVSLTLSGLAFIFYGYYEYGVSRYAAIRLDMFLILPILLLSLAIFLASVVLLFKRKSNG
jgi:hypothetical protein